MEKQRSRPWVAPVVVGALGWVFTLAMVLALAGDSVAWMLNSHEDEHYSGPATYIVVAVAVTVIGIGLAVWCFAGARALDRPEHDDTH